MSTPVVLNPLTVVADGYGKTVGVTDDERFKVDIVTNAAPHADTHIQGGSDEIDADQLDIDYDPSSYTNTSSPSEVTSADQLTGHLAGIDNALGTTQDQVTNIQNELDGYATTSHADTHIQGGSDEIDGDQLDIDFSPTGYTPSTSPAEVTDIDHLSAHLAGISDALESAIDGYNLADVGVVLVHGLEQTAYLTITEALANAVAGDRVVVGPGTYAESFTVPPQVTVLCSQDRGAAQILGSAPTGTRVQLSDLSAIVGFRIYSPTDDSAAVKYTGSSASYFASAQELTFVGQGGSGPNVCKDGYGTLLVNNPIHLFGNTGAMLCNKGYGLLSVAIITDALVLSGDLDVGVSVTNGTISVVEAMIIAAPSNTTNGVYIEDGNLFMTSGTFQGVTNGIYIAAGTSDVQARSVRIDADTYDIVAESGVDGSILHLSACEFSENKTSLPSSWLATGNVIMTYQDATTGVEGFKVLGELNVGKPEVGKESLFGEGDSYTRDMVILTTDSTADTNDDGGNFIDVSPAGVSPGDGYTFSFQGTSAGHSILIGSNLENADGDKLKHWGLQVLQTTAAVEATKRSFVFERWDGSEWTEIGVMSTESTRFYRYANEVFIRANSDEHIRYGILEESDWEKKTIHGFNLYWMRIRITDSLTTAPVFEQFKLSTSRFAVNIDGTNTFHGRSRFRQTLQAAGNVFGESGSVANFSMSIGTGGLPTGWTHQIKNASLGSNGAAIYYQFVLPRGVDTSIPLDFNITFETQATSSSAGLDFVFSMMPLEVQGVLEADPSGGIEPVERTLANTEVQTSKAGLFENVTVDNVDALKLHRFSCTGFRIDDYYEGDLILIRLEIDDDGPSDIDVGVVGLEINGARWTHGERL